MLGCRTKGSTLHEGITKVCLTFNMRAEIFAGKIFFTFVILKIKKVDIKIRPKKEII